MSRTNFDILPSQKNADELLMPQYIVSPTPQANIGGCDGSGNVLDNSGAVVTNTYCGFLKTYDCNNKDASGNPTCSYRSGYLGAFIATFVGGAILASILGAVAYSYKNIGLAGVGISFIVLLFWIIIPIIIAVIFNSNYPSS